MITTPSENKLIFYKTCLQQKFKSSINQQLFNGGVAQLVRARDS